MQVLTTSAPLGGFDLMRSKLEKHSSPTGIAEKCIRKKRPIHTTEPSCEESSSDTRMQQLFAARLQAWQRVIAENQDYQVTGECTFSPVFSLMYAGVCCKGSNPATPSKPNQDRILVFEDAVTSSLVLACLDGHGLHGHSVAQYFKTMIAKNLCKHPLFASDPQRAIAQVLVQIEYELYAEGVGGEKGLADYSGTTLSLLLLRGDQALVCNVGDSRVVLGRRQGGDSGDIVQAQQVTIDHKPHLPAEHHRITQTGGRVFAIRYNDNSVGPPRVWLGGANVPGLAMSRSLGDFVVHTAGVISTPDFFGLDLRGARDLVVLVGSDGVWDSMSPSEAAALAFSQVEGGVLLAAQAVVTEARGRSQLRERVVDDASLCIVHIRGTGHRNNPGSCTFSEGD